MPEIREDELRGGFFTAIGIPRPLEASLDRDGVGALRTASFRGGITFREQIAVWQRNERLGFTDRRRAGVDPAGAARRARAGRQRALRRDLGRIPPRAAAAGRTRLVLLSRHRLSTRFNAYAGLWTDAVMRDLQERICEVIARRAAGGRRLVIPDRPQEPRSEARQRLRAGRAVRDQPAQLLRPTAARRAGRADSQGVGPERHGAGRRQHRLRAALRLRGRAARTPRRPRGARPDPRRRGLRLERAHGGHRPGAQLRGAVRVPARRGRRAKPAARRPRLR